MSVDSHRLWLSRCRWRNLEADLHALTQYTLRHAYPEAIPLAKAADDAAGVGKEALCQVELKVKATEQNTASVTEPM